MFSFFRSSKKPSPAESAEEVSSAASLPGDDYVMIEQRNRQPQPDPLQQHSTGGGGVYPSLGPDGPNVTPTFNRTQSETFSYLQGVPFKLSPDIRMGDGDPTEVARYEVDQILANMTRAMDMYSGEL